MDTDLCYVYGPHASGKGVLCRLLDGHSELGVTIHHDAFPRLFNNLNSTDEISEDLLYYKLRSYLEKTRYYELEDYANGQDHPHLQLSSEKQSKTGINIDFYQVDQSWMAKVDPSTRTTEIIKLIFHALFSNMSEYPYDKSGCQYYVGMGDRRPRPMRKLIQNERSSKVIFIYRDPRAVVASKGSRPQNRSIQEYILKGRLFEAEQHIQVANRLKQQYPSQVLIITFEELILSSDRTVEKVSDFLDIKREEIMYSPTFCGNKLTPESDYIGEIKDNWKELASKHERCALDFQSGKIPANITLPGVKLYLSSLGRETVKETYTEIRRRGRDILS